MKAARWMSILIVIAFVTVPGDVTAAGQSSSGSRDPWPPIFKDDAAMKDCPQQPGAAAVLLVREELMDYEKGATKVFRRLKVLTPAGLDRSNIEIPFLVGREKVTGIQARVVYPKGDEREFTGQILEKTAMRYRKLRVAVKTFALPDVEVGSIIDYRYSIEPDHGRVSAAGLHDILIGLEGGEWGEEGGIAESKHLRAAPVERWEVQEDLFTKRAKFSYANKNLILMLIFGEGYRLAWASVGIAKGTPQILIGQASMELNDIPAFEAEEFSIPESMLRMSVDLFFISNELKSYDEFWKLESQDWQKGVQSFLGKPKQLEVVAHTIVGDATEPLAQLERIYRKVQGLRNLSYEKDLTSKQRKEQKIKDNRRALDVLDRGYGLRSDITRTFVALARAAGFEAEVIRVVARDDQLFRKEFLSFYDQFDSEAALVKVADKTLLVDPATPFCPFGLAHWSRTNATAVRFSENPPAFFTTPLSPPSMAVTQREIALKLDPQGGLEGTIKTTYTGQEALVRRLDLLRDDAEARKAAFEKELSDVLPMGASASLTKLENIDASDPFLIALYDVKIPNAAMAAGDKLLLPVFPLTGPVQYPFRPSGRKSAVYLPYACREFDDVVITLPEGMTAEVRPEPRKIESDAFSYSLACSEEEPGRLHIQRDLTITKIFYPVEKYSSIKGLFDAARAASEAQIVLTAAKEREDY